MGKQQNTIYTCDRCGEVISDQKYLIVGRYKFMNILKWWCPAIQRYKLAYLCPHCAKEYDKFLKVEGDK